ncbi:hypothetical protein [Sulfobacillus harzensis]|uniref:Uncharacterized protein n=1 Tax=Sulfobacillus harzensis TaxID=2729629 RepID=A0A7Y0Q4K1_9FIRM|nr:hypothetical protein [Sulfobacillus harzensis]NMP24106.1 hypothetical protein [Sulfobacillus harzensis]
MSGHHAGSPMRTSCWVVPGWVSQDAIAQWLGTLATETIPGWGVTYRFNPCTRAYETEVWLWTDEAAW